ncbi:MAG: ABC transporter ATP-binding protein [Planctomycetia bacterium]|nr:ABC transporter ATP-binding protein [Planctomycetia bacterium]
MKPAISVHNISKQYRLGLAPSKDNNLTENMRLMARNAWDKVRRLATPKRAIRQEESFWALKDVSFDVMPGEVVGIIGRNGAGKSTLLKVLSHIVEPTAGYADIRGRMGSLLEVGTGFHPELTGRENIYLNGAILGMKREEITRKFDEIVAFAEVEKFLDTPVKRYSSGMYVRLAFSVAAHLEPEILIVDEVLAVGDQSFQNKCLGRMRDISRDGRTVVIVSHQMASLKHLCTKAICFKKGRVAFSGDAKNVIDHYQRLNRTEYAEQTTDLREIETDRRERILFQSVYLLNDQQQAVESIALGDTLRIKIHIDPKGKLESPKVGIGIDDMLGQRLLTVHTPASQDVTSTIQSKCAVVCEIPNFPLAPGDYSMKLALTDRNCEVDAVEHAMLFTVQDAEQFGEGRVFHRGVCIAPSVWSVKPSGN